MEDLFGEEKEDVAEDKAADEKEAPAGEAKQKKAEGKLDSEEKPQKKTRRTIKGNLTYSNTPGKTRDVLNALIPAQRPDRFTQAFLNDTLHQTGGSANQQIGVLKSLGLLDSSGVPTELYALFQQDSTRSAAAIEALRKGYVELFRSNSQVHQAQEDRLKEAIAKVTGLAKNDRVVGYIRSTFNVIKEFITDPEASLTEEDEKEERQQEDRDAKADVQQVALGNLGLQYNINLVLPQANNIEVYDLIFRSLRENILDWSK